jgi:hypothetical protein
MTVNSNDFLTMRDTLAGGRIFRIYDTNPLGSGGKSKNIWIDVDDRDEFQDLFDRYKDEKKVGRESFFTVFAEKQGYHIAEMEMPEEGFISL